MSFDPGFDPGFDSVQACAEALLAGARAMHTHRLNVGTAGNLSVRWGAGMLITPSGRDYATCGPQDMVWVALQAREQERAGEAAPIPPEPLSAQFARHPPSSEWRMHRDLYRARPEVGAVVHAHSPFATALACQGREIPPFHYMIARFGGANVRCAPYAVFGSAELSAHAVAALQERSACLLANHGMLALGATLSAALAQAVEFEALCEQYWRSAQLGPPQRLSDAQMAEVIERFRWYGSGWVEPDSPSEPTTNGGVSRYRA